MWNTRQFKGPRRVFHCSTGLHGRLTGFRPHYILILLNLGPVLLNLGPILLNLVPVLLNLGPRIDLPHASYLI